MLHCYREELTILYLNKYFIFNENNYNPAKTCRLLQPAVDLCLFGLAVAGILVVVVVVVVKASVGAQMVVMARCYFDQVGIWSPVRAAGTVDGEIMGIMGV